MCGILINFSSFLYEYICISLMHFKESLCLAWLSCKESSMLQFKTFTVYPCDSSYPCSVFQRPLFMCCNFFFLPFVVTLTQPKNKLYAFANFGTIYIFKWLFLITLSQPKKDMTLLTSELHKNGITHHNAFAIAFFHTALCLEIEFCCFF